MTVLVAATAVLGLPSIARAETPAATPAAKPSVTASCGAAQKGQVACYALRRDDVKASKGVRPMADAPTGYGPADLLGAYQIPANGGAGATIGIVDAFDDPTAEADLAVYRQQFGLPACTTDNGCFKKIDQRGGTSYPTPDPGWAGEISLDLDMVSAMAPNAHILLVEADSTFFTDMGASVDQAVAQGAKYVSNSYGTNYSSDPGSGEDPSEITDFDRFYNHPGVVMTVSSGDGDYGVAYPAASPFVTSVGGTSLVRSGDPRGWSESVWHNSIGGPGSGCSAYEPKPDFQKDTGCANRSVADVSAVSDPVTGVAVYQTFGHSGWAVYGGTSAAAPIIAGVYATAGSPIAGTYPNSYPYDQTAGLNDITAGANGTCSPAYLCTAGPGYDGPTGLGTPKGVSAFTAGAHGEVLGTVTDAATGNPVAGAVVTAGESTGTSGADGKYDIHAPVGTYDVTVSAYGYSSKTVPGVVVAEGASVTEDFALDAVPSSTVHGTVTDDSGHGWPLYAKVTADGVPGGGVYTDPASGRYSLTLPQGSDYTLHVTPVYSGYESATRTVTVGASAVTADVPVKVDAASCTAPGYKLTQHGGATQSFDGTTAPDGWSVTNADGTVGGWTFTDDGNRGNHTGGAGGFAIIDSDHFGGGNHQDTYLTAPAAAVTAGTTPLVAFDTDYNPLASTATVQVSVDGGATWVDAWSRTSTALRGPAHVEVPLPQATGKASAQVRFHYTGSFAWWWEVDDVFFGSTTCDVVKGGLVFGQVTDGNTGAAIGGAEVTVPDAPSVSATSAATPDDPAVGDGFYWLFAPVTGTHEIDVKKGHYTTATKKVTVAADDATAADFTLGAGQLTVTPDNITKTVAWQGTASAVLTVKNTGSAPATAKISERPGDTTPLLRGGAPLNQVKGTISNRAAAATGPATKAAKADVNPSAAPWQPIADFPGPVQDNLVAYQDGKVYSVYGWTGEEDTSSAAVFDPESGAWTALAPATDAREQAKGDFVGGKLVTTGGWGPGGTTDAKTEIYDPAANSWSIGAPNPTPLAASGRAVLDGKLYLVGGCTANACGTNTVTVYDAEANSWTTAAPYPVAVAWEACGAIAGTIYCAGGNTDASTLTSTYAYDPGTNSWSVKAALPADLWGSASAAANGLLLISGGVVNDNSTITNQGYSYDPAADAWSPLPNANESRYRAGSACGLYRIGGNPGGSFTPPGASSEVLPGFTGCGAASDVSWLSTSAGEVTLQPGKTAKVTVTLNANVADITQPGIYTAAVAFSTDTPYALSSVPVTMTVNPPKTWGKIAGTITSAANGSAIAGATLQVDSWASSYTLKTKADGTYELWLDTRNNPLQLIAAKDGFQPQTAKVRITKGATTTTDFSLKKS